MEGIGYVEVKMIYKLCVVLNRYFRFQTSICHIHQKDTVRSGVGECTRGLILL